MSVPATNVSFSSMRDALGFEPTARPIKLSQFYGLVSGGPTTGAINVGSYKSKSLSLFPAASFYLVNAATGSVLKFDGTNTGLINHGSGAPVTLSFTPLQVAGYTDSYPGYYIIRHNSDSSFNMSHYNYTLTMTTLYANPGPNFAYKPEKATTGFVVRNPYTSYTYYVFWNGNNYQISTFASWFYFRNPSATITNTPADNAVWVLDAAALTPTLSAGSAVPAWGIGVQSTVANQPTYNTVASIPYVQFSAGLTASGGDYLDLNQGSLSPIYYVNGPGCTYVLVAKFTSVTQEAYLTRSENAGSDVCRVFEYKLGSDGSIWAGFYYNNHYITMTSTDTGANNVWKMYVIRQNTTSNKLEGWINNTLKVTGTTTGGGNATGNPTNATINRQVYSSYCSGVLIAYVGLWYRSLSTTEMTAIYNRFSSIIGT